jgi:hypothetical protein
MPLEAIPFVGGVIAAFLLFIVVVGGVSIWSSLPSPENAEGDAVRPSGSGLDAS